MTSQGFALFDTAIGPCGIAWAEDGIIGVQLPERSTGATRARLRKRFPDLAERTPSPEAAQALDGMVALLNGDQTDLTGIRLDLTGVPDFHRKAYEIARTIPPGATLSYGDIATRLNAPGSARAVGQAMGNNPFAIIVPCHRVVAADGRIGGFSATGGSVTKIRMLAIERPDAAELTLFDLD
jgi:methylated-DNA-[protein]-cysteine S-methyltransferase